MQIFRYMVYIRESYEKEERREKGISRRENFRYPPILPIVYYEGRQEWTVPLDFKSRIREGKTFAKYIPDFHYYLVPLRKFSNKELLDKEDEISLIMLVNKLQELGDITSFRTLPQEKLEAALKDTPDHIAGIIADILLAFLLKSRIPADEAEEVAGKVRKKKVGELFADMEPIDIPAEQEKIRKQRQEIEAEQQKMKVAQQEMVAERQKIDAEQIKMKAEKAALEAAHQELMSQRQELEKMKQEMKAAMEQFKNTHE